MGSAKALYVFTNKGGERDEFSDRRESCYYTSAAVTEDTGSPAKVTDAQQWNDGVPEVSSVLSPTAAGSGF